MKKQVIEFLDMLDKNRRERIEEAAAEMRKLLDQKKPKLQMFEIEK